MSADPTKYYETINAVRSVSRKMIFWLPCVRLPLLAVALGASSRFSAWSFVYGLIGLLVSVVPPIPPVIGVVIYLFTNNVWLSCFFMGLGFGTYIESRSNYFHTKIQTETVLSDILSSRTNYVLEEIEVPKELLVGFHYGLKDLEKRVAQRFGRKIDDLITKRAAPLRVFRFRPSVAGKCISAAVAFTVNRYSSLVFVRQGFENLNDAQRFQLFHELAHGTLYGTDILLRPLRWKVVTPIANGMALALLLAFFLRLLQAPKSLMLWVAFACLLVANGLRKSAVAQVIALSVAASEVLADSIALTHPEFVKNGKWRERAENLARRLNDERACMSRTDPRHTEVFFREFWLRRWLSLGYVRAYLTHDVDPRLFVALPLYVTSGYWSGFPATWAAYGFWLLILGLVICSLQLGFNGMRANRLLISVDTALNERLQ